MLIRYYGAARAATGTAQETITPGPDTLAALIQFLTTKHAGTTAAGTAFADILPRCSFLSAGQRLEPAAVLQEADTIDVLPPFCGG